jgi:hypothetical protein
MYSYKNNYPIEDLPSRHRNEDGSTVTDLYSLSTEGLSALGYVHVDDPPEYSQESHKLEWSETEWVLVELSVDELAEKRTVLENEIRFERNGYFEKEFWRLERYQSEVRLNLTPTDDITKLDEYFQKLRDIPKQESFPNNIVWPNIDEGEVKLPETGVIPDAEIE